MIRDVLTVLWRELLYLRRASRASMVLLRLLAFVVIIGAIVPYQAGRAWLDSPLPLLYWGWLAVYMASAATSGSFAREREQRTLETLLATRLPDAAILLGKIAAGVVYAGLLALASLLLGQVVLGLDLGVAAGGYRASVAVGGFLVTLLAAFGIGGLASLTSLRAGTARQAQASLGLVLLALFLPLVAGQLVPGADGIVRDSALALDADLVILGAVLALALLDLVLWLAARRAFRRSRLIRVT